MLANLGAYVGSDRQLLSPFGQIITLTGVYDIPAAHVTIDAVLSNTSPTAPYRGAGRPEACYLMERILEVASRELGIDPVEPRRSLISRRLCRIAPLGPVYDSGDSPEICNLRSAFRLCRIRARRRVEAAANCGIALVNDRAGGWPSSNLPRFASSRAAVPCCSWAPISRSGPRNVVQAIPHENIDPRRFSSSMATPIAWPSAWAQRFTVNGCRRLGAGLAADKSSRRAS
jgi:carbon-monoxide dehydrogenase large subunit